MSDLNKFHDEAMDKAFFADQERRRGNEERALDLELKALAEITESIDQDGLTWSVLHRSAGWLALDCNRPRLAEQLACKALAGDPHPEIAEELRDLLAETYARMHGKPKGASVAKTVDS